MQKHDKTLVKNCINLQYSPFHTYQRNNNYISNIHVKNKLKNERKWEMGTILYNGEEAKKQRKSSPPNTCPIFSSVYVHLYLIYYTAVLTEFAPKRQLALLSSLISHEVP